MNFLIGTKLNFADTPPEAPGQPPECKYSRDCESCRQRRIKCDLARPSCGQCLRARKSCLGYRDEATMRFRNATISSFQPSTGHGYRKMRCYGPPMIIADSSQHRSISSVQMIYEPSQVWRHHVIPLVLAKFSVSLVDPSMFATIPRIISSMQEGSPIYATCDAIACAYLASTTGSTDAIANRTRSYGVALRTVNAALDDPVQCKNDNTLLAVWMFVVYEFLSNPHLTAIAGSDDGDRHCRGMASLIDLRGSDQFCRQDGRDLIWFVCYCTQAKALIAGRESPTKVLSWIHELCQYLKPFESIMIQSCTFAYHCTRLCSKIRKVLTGNLNLMLAAYSSILEQMDEIEKTWSSSYDSHQPSISSIGVHAYQGNFQMHLSANVLNFLLRVCQADCSHQQHLHSTAMQERCISTFRATATRIFQMLDMLQGTNDLPSNHFNLGWGDAVMVHGSLRTITVSHISLDWQRDIANRVLVMIKEQLGFQLLL